MTYTIDRNGQRFGPYVRDEVLGYLAQGTLLLTDFAWCAEQQRWLVLSEVIQSPVDPMALFVGRKYHSYFKAKWTTIDGRPRGLSWSWAALLGIYWLAYRKMHPYVLGVLGLTFISALAQIAGVDSEILILLGVLESVICILLAFFGNRLYKHFAESKVRSIMAQGYSESAYSLLVRSGGTSIGSLAGWVVAFFLVGCLPLAVEQLKPLFAGTAEASPNQEHVDGVKSSGRIPAGATPAQIKPIPAQKAPGKFDAARGVWWIDDSPLIEEYGQYLFQAFTKNPSLVKALRQMRPDFDPDETGTALAPAAVARLADDRVLYIARGCRPHACNLYQATVAIDSVSGEVFLYETGQQEKSDGQWEKFYGRSDEGVRNLLREM